MNATELRQLLPPHLQELSISLDGHETKGSCIAWANDVFPDVLDEIERLGMAISSISAVNVDEDGYANHGYESWSVKRREEPFALLVARSKREALAYIAGLRPEQRQPPTPTPVLIAWDPYVAED